MEDPHGLVPRLKELFWRQKLAALCTEAQDQPYGSLVAFAASRDLEYIMFATNRATRKYANLLSNGRAAMLVDDRTNDESDFRSAVAVTATGVAEEVDGADREALLSVYLIKHPGLEGFVTAANCALFRLKVDTYFVVTEFQNVTEIHMDR
jgi:hypothetical protein